MPVSEPAIAPAPPFCISLHVRHPAIDPRLISTELGCEPEDAFGAGEPRTESSGVYGETYWAARLEPEFWRAAGYLRPFDPPPPLPEAAPAEPLPEDSRSRLKLLIARGREQGYLTHAELIHYTGIEEGASLEELARTLAELGIPVHEPESSQLAAIERLRAIDQGALRAYIGRNPALQLSDCLALVCVRLTGRHAAFLEKIRAGGGSVRLLVTVPSKALHGLTITPELSSRLSQLGVTLELALAMGPRTRKRAS